MSFTWQTWFHFTSKTKCWCPSFMGFKMVEKPPYSLCIENIELEPGIIEKLLTCQGIFSKKYPMSMDWYHDTARWYWSVDTLLWQLPIYYLLITKWMCNIGLQAPKLSGKCEIKHFLPLWYVIFLGWIDFPSHVAPLVHVKLCLYLLFYVTFSNSTLYKVLQKLDERHSFLLGPRSKDKIICCLEFLFSCWLL